MLFKLALRNIKKSIKDYSIYFFTLVIAVAIFYIFNSIDAQKSMLTLTSSKQDMIKILVECLNYVSVFVSIILGFLIIYSNNFLIKRRKKEIGLYETLGMSKRKTSSIIVIETLLVGIISLAVGLLIGVGLSQLVSIFTAKLFKADMSKFQFVFSIDSLVKTIIYFGIIFILVMIFNVITLSRYKLIDLLNANKKNEKVKIRNKYVTFITFVLSIACLAYAYYLLFNNALLKLPSTDALKMIIFGALGTFLFFLSLSGFLLKILEKTKKIYYKNLNMFILKQVNNKINTSVISTTVICLMLLLTIGILSGSMSLTSAYNGSLSENNMSDITIQKTDYIDNEESGTSIFSLPELEGFSNYIKNYAIYTTKMAEEITIDKLLTSKAKEEAKKEIGKGSSFDYKIPIISETEYKNIMKLYNIEPIDIDDDEYLIIANLDMVVKYYNESLNTKNTIILNNKQLKSATLKVIELPVMNYPSDGNDGLLVISDNLTENLQKGLAILLGNYVDSKTHEQVESELKTFLNNSEINGFHLMSKIEMEAASVGTTALLTFIGLYLGIVFAISSATVLAIGQLSESSDNRERYRILKQIGADDKEIKRALLVQISIAFLLPLVVALIHAIFGLKEINSIIKIVANIDLVSNIILTTSFIVFVYGGYFLGTYLCSKNIIKDNK